LQAALKREGAHCDVTKDLRKVKSADALLLPGVGSFTAATSKIRAPAVREIVLNGKPLLGICLGLQLFFRSSEEGRGRGLELLPGEVKRLPAGVKIPQIGWNLLKIKRQNELVEGLSNDGWVYYVHSYYPSTDGQWVAATSEYGVQYPCLIAWKNIFGTQFHPEKSGITGRLILRNFLNIIRR
jgi:glutamine amidotransferase